jgi:calcyclin binding protein
VRVYVTSGVDGVGKHDKNQIDCEFTDNSFDLRVLHFPVPGKHLRLKMGPLNGLIQPAASKMKVKSNSIVLEMKKSPSNKKWWDNIKKSKLGSAPQDKKKEDDSAADPGASLMTMMKELYENGDDEMKRTIAETWTKTQKDKAMGGAGMKGL